jgi:hypothetical protein
MGAGRALAHGPFSNAASRRDRDGVSNRCLRDPDNRRSIHQIAVGDAVEVGETALRWRGEINTRQKLGQAPMCALGLSGRQRRLVIDIDIGRHEMVKQLAQRAVLGRTTAEIEELLLEGAEGMQAVVLLFKPRAEIVHVSLFKYEKKL